MVRGLPQLLLHVVLSAISQAMSMFTVRVQLEELPINPELLYDGNQRLSKFTYVQRILTLNKSAVQLLHHLDQFALGNPALTQLPPYAPTAQTPNPAQGRRVLATVFSHRSSSLHRVQVVEKNATPL